MTTDILALTPPRIYSETAEKYGTIPVDSHSLVILKRRLGNAGVYRPNASDGIVQYANGLAWFQTGNKDTTVDDMRTSLRTFTRGSTDKWIGLEHAKSQDDTPYRLPRVHYFPPPPPVPSKSREMLQATFPASVIPRVVVL
ncbi:unnamed protein product [Nezara viridula]|uniref:Uncharacterized protein n=1 Tax=Nezara viridula TaxID=85310 RepID=A0A9P0MU91_NEZVI|nr:unnamed protein product [Nezara viridula]